MKHSTLLIVFTTLFSSSLLAQTSFFEVGSLTTGVGGFGSGTLGANTFNFAATDGGRIGINSSTNNSSAAFMNSTFTGVDAAFQEIAFPTSPFGYGRADTIMFGVSSGNKLTINFGMPQSGLALMLSNLDGDWDLSEPFRVADSSPTLGVRANGDLYSTAYDGTIPSFNLGRGIIYFDSPVSSLTFTKNGGPADDFYLGMAVVPETSSALLAALSSMVLLRRKRK